MGEVGSLTGSLSGSLMAAAPPPPTSAALQQKDHQVILIQEWGIGEVALKKKISKRASS